MLHFCLVLSSVSVVLFVVKSQHANLKEMGALALMTLHWVLDYPNSDYLNAPLSKRLDEALFSAPEFCYRRRQSCYMNNFSQMLQCLFQPVQDLDPDYNVRACWAKPCTLEYTTLQCGKLRGGVSRTILGFDHSHDRLIVALALFRYPCQQFRPPGD